MKNYPTFKAPKTAKEFYFLSFTWGLLTTLAGMVVALVMLIKGYRPKRFGWMIVFEIPMIDWGMSLGIVMLAPEGDSEADYRLKCHEHGHALQNIYLGPLFPLLVAIPSVIRFQWRETHTVTTDYDDIWFEGSATSSGLLFMEDFNESGD